MLPHDFSKKKCSIIYSKNNNLNAINVHKILDSGAFGDVYECDDNNKIDKKYAMKVIAHNDLVNRKEIKFYKMATIWKNYDYYLPKIYCIMADMNNYYILMKHLGTNHFNHKYYCQQKFNTGQLYILFENLMRAIQYFHKKELILNDIKPRNIMIINDNHLQVKIIDCGLITKYDDPKQLSTGTLYYIPPEIFDKNYQYKKKIINDKKDIWSLGIILYKFLVGNNPIKNLIEFDEFGNMIMYTEKLFDTIIKMEEKMKELKIDKNLSNIILQSLNRNPIIRPSIDILINLLHNP